MLAFQIIGVAFTVLVLAVLVSGKAPVPSR